MGKQPALTIAVRLSVRGSTKVLTFKGCTPIDNPAPRWSAYVKNLRDAGIKIETIHEGHKGPFPGTHGRHVLKSSIEVVKPYDNPDSEAA